MIALAIIGALITTMVVAGMILLVPSGAVDEHTRAFAPAAASESEPRPSGPAVPSDAAGAPGAPEGFSSVPGVDLQHRIVARRGEFLLFALTPPRLSTTPEKAQEIADVTFERLEPLDVDGLILYDIDDEADRNPDERPFPFFPTMDPADYLDRHLKDWRTPVVVYRATAKYSEQDLRDWMASLDTATRMAVFVGASTRETRVATTLRRAQQLRSEVNPELLLGAVAIPERHTRKGDEHLRLAAKQEAGCSYFVTQVDLRRQRCQESGIRLCLRVPRSRPRSGPDRVHLFGVRLDADLGVPPMARRRRPALGRKRPAPRRGRPRRIPRACRGNRA